MQPVRTYISPLSVLGIAMLALAVFVAIMSSSLIFGIGIFVAFSLPALLLHRFIGKETRRYWWHSQLAVSAIIIVLFMLAYHYFVRILWVASLCAPYSVISAPYQSFPWHPCCLPSGCCLSGSRLRKIPLGSLLLLPCHLCCSIGYLPGSVFSIGGWSHTSSLLSYSSLYLCVCMPWPHPCAKKHYHMKPIRSYISPLSVISLSSLLIAIWLRFFGGGLPEFSYMLLLIITLPSLLLHWLINKFTTTLWLAAQIIASFIFFFIFMCLYALAYAVF